MSALSAWINNDFGDGQISKLFYDGVITEEQMKIAEQTRKLINKQIGSYEDYKMASTYPDKVKPEIIKRAKNLAALAIQLQWVEGDASSAENSFFKINQQASPIDKTELLLLKSRKKPNSIAARAIIRSGRGHKYWSGFSNKIQSDIQNLAKEINQILFDPKLVTPIKTLDIPIGGKIYSAQTLPLVLDFVNLANNYNPKNKIDLNDDNTGEITVKYLKETRKIAWLLNSQHPSSLGLHPAVYFYSLDGRYKIASFFAIVDLVMELKKRNMINKFIDVRSNFEIIIQKYEYIIQQINRKHRSVQGSYRFISQFMQLSIELLKKFSIEETIDQIINKNEFNYLTKQLASQLSTTQKDFTTEKKSAIFLKEALKNTPKCKICNGLIHRNSISIDHIERKRDGGVADINNAQLTHPYCNSGYKN